MSRLLLFVALVSALAVGRTARADEGPATCEQSYVTAQSARRDGHLLLARQALLVCAHDPCAPELKVDCEQWAAENEAHVPSIVVSLRDPTGADVSEARVEIDGRAVATTLDGHALDLDPGPHDVSVAPSGRDGLHRKIVLREGEKLRQIAFEEAAPSPPAAPTTSPHATRSLWPAYAATTLGAVAVGGTVTFGIVGASNRAEHCPGGTCASTRAYDDVKPWYVATDLSLGVAVAAAAVATVWFLTHRGSPSPMAATAPLTWAF